MWVKLKGGMAGPNGSFRAGSIVDLEEKLARHLLKTGQASPVDQPKLESATVKPPEQAARTELPEPKVDDSWTIAELRALCADRGIEIDAIEGSGKDGNVLKADLLAALAE